MSFKEELLSQEFRAGGRLVQIADVTIPSGGEQYHDFAFSSAAYTHFEIVWDCGVNSPTGSTLVLQPDGSDAGCFSFYWINNGIGMTTPVDDAAGESCTYALFGMIGDSTPSGGMLSMRSCGPHWWREGFSYTAGPIGHQKHCGYMPAWTTKLRIASLTSLIPAGTRFLIYGVPAPS